MFSERLKIMYFRYASTAFSENNYQLLHVCPSVRPSVCPHGTGQPSLDEFCSIYNKLRLKGRQTQLITEVYKQLITLRATSFVYL